MSEIKGTLLSVILALTVFGIVFGLLTVAIRQSAKDVSKQITDADKTPVPAEVVPNEE